MFRVRINHSYTAWERALVDVEAPNEEAAVDYVRELYDDQKLPDSVGWKEYYSETEQDEVVPAVEEYDGTPEEAEVVVPAGWQPA
jgi:hypothetical protein